MDLCHRCKKSVGQILVIGGLSLCLLCAEAIGIFHVGLTGAQHTEQYNEPPRRAVAEVVAPASGSTLTNTSFLPSAPIKEA